MPQISGGLKRSRHRLTGVAAAALLLIVGHHGNAVAQEGGNRDDRRRSTEEAQRTEGAAIVQLADAALTGKAVPTDFLMRWHPDFLKAQQGTFVPFVLTVDSPNLPNTPALLYVRAVAKGTSQAPLASKPPRPDDRKERSGKRDDDIEPRYPVDIIFPVEVQSGAGRPARIMRGFSVPPGDYEVCLVLRERPDVGAAKDRPVRAAVLKQAMTVPNFWTDELAISSVILADRLTLLPEALPPDQLPERPYIIGLNDVEPAADARFGKGEELICVFLVYNPKVGADKTFDVLVEYHFYRRMAGSGGEPAGGGEHPPARAGERYVNHTEPQHFTEGLLGVPFNPASGQPIMAGQGVPLAAFEEGDYRLMIKVTDLLAGRTLTRDVNFTVGS